MLFALQGGTIAHSLMDGGVPGVICIQVACCIYQQNVYAIDFKSAVN